MIKKAVITAGGLGTRFLPFTKAIPKEMLPVMNKPAIHVIVDMLGQCGVEEVLIIINRHKKVIIDYFNRHEPWERQLQEKNALLLEQYQRDFYGLPIINFEMQHQPSGLADALLHGERFTGDEPFLVILGDVIIEEGVSHLVRLIKAYSETLSPVIGLATVERERISCVGIAEPEDQAGCSSDVFMIRRVVEKPDPREVTSNLSILGSYIFPGLIYDLLRSSMIGRSHMKEVDLSDALNTLVERDRLFGVMHHGAIYDIGTPQTWFRLNEALFTGKIKLA
ncbi:UTP--glucose-1-phosphate uridylyltransferase [Fontibacillus phaseoli]|uniref:UTP--glucose-1-phosphate uridylyltransferase n=1 Tax=Fontibacillus phaseoli TaxID=1416533 RepID=A0A369B753_9BACL|nr:sugar phosphate nucleotidyltransferase [Fontibacillus phaseoli]RCX17343.1 UTP--glucose-1-phosphate uridylyltransferase [Fontibacillus phaseoli]